MLATFGLALIGSLPLVGLGSYAFGWWWRGRYDRQRQLELEAAHGSALQAIEYALEHAHPEGDEFLRAWRIGDLSEWPEYYEWLGRDGPVFPFKICDHHPDLVGCPKCDPERPTEPPVRVTRRCDNHPTTVGCPECDPEHFGYTR